MTTYDPRQVLADAQTVLAAIADSYKTKVGTERRFPTGLLGLVKLILVWDARTRNLQLSYQFALGPVRLVWKWQNGEVLFARDREQPWQNALARLARNTRYRLQEAERLLRIQMGQRVKQETMGGLDMPHPIRLIKDRPPNRGG